MSKTPVTTSNSLASGIQKDVLIRGIIESDVLVSNTADFDIESVMNDFALSASKIVFGSHEHLHLLLQDKDSKDAYCSQSNLAGHTQAPTPQSREKVGPIIPKKTGMSRKLESGDLRFASSNLRSGYGSHGKVKCEGCKKVLGTCSFCL